MTIYHEGNRRLQDAFETRLLADRLEERNVKAEISQVAKEFIEARDMFFLATADADGTPTCSYKGGDPGFVRVVDEHTVAFPSYDGNGMFLSMGNTLVNPRVGMLFIDFEGQRRVRLQGEASINPADPLLAAYPEAQFVVRVRATQVFVNCPRYVHKYQLVERSAYVPKDGCETPVAPWKRTEAYADVIPARDRAILGQTRPASE